MSNRRSTTGSSSSVNKPRKTKSETIRTAVAKLLKERNYVSRENRPMIMDKRNFMLEKMIERDTRCSNYFLYSNPVCLSNNSHIVDQQFCRFTQYVEEQDDELRVELRRFYAPMICHLYIELLKARETKAASEFLKKYAHLVAPVDTYEAPLPTKINGCSVTTNNNDSPSNEQSTTLATSLISIRFLRDIAGASAIGWNDDPDLQYFMKIIEFLSTCLDFEVAQSDVDVSHLRRSKYEIHTTEEVVKTLFRYFKARGHVLLLSIINNWIYIHMVDLDTKGFREEDLLYSQSEDSELEDENPTLEEKQSWKKFLEPAVETGIKSESAAETMTDMKLASKDYHVRICMETLNSAKRIYQKVQQPEIPRFISIADRENGLTSAAMDANECHLVAGFNNSEIKLWQMNQHSSAGKHLYRRFEDTKCPFEINNCAKETEDVIENDIKKHMRVKVDRKERTFYEHKYDGNSYNEFGGIELRGHGSGVTNVRFSKHYNLIYSISKDSTMRAWHANNYDCAAIYRGHRHPIWCFDESSTGVYVATGSKDLTARLWALEREYPLITFVGHTQDVECISFHANGCYLATGSTDVSVRLWDVTSGEQLRLFDDCKQPVTSIAFSPNGLWLAAGGEESKVRIFDLAAGKQLHELKDHTACVTDIAWNRYSTQLATVCRDGSLRMWDVQKLESITYQNPTQGISNSSTSNTAQTTSTSTTQYSPSSSTHSNISSRLLALNSNCPRLVKTFFSRNESLCCIGASKN